MSTTITRKGFRQIHFLKNLHLFPLDLMMRLFGKGIASTIHGIITLIQKTILVMLGMIGLFGCSKVDALFETSRPVKNKTYDEAILEDLPDPVQRYFRFALQDGQPYLSYLRLKHSGTFKTGPDKEWMEIHGEQYFTARPPAFVWKGKTRMFRARDSYVEDQGNLSVYLFGLIRIVNEKGEKIDQAELLRWLGESVWMPTNLLPGDHLRWSPIDEHTAKLTFTHNGISVYYIIEFDREGRIVRMETERYMDEQLEKWEGMVSDYRPHNGMMVPVSIEGSWLLGDGKYTYARFHVEEFEYDVPSAY